MVTEERLEDRVFRLSSKTIQQGVPIGKHDIVLLFEQIIQRQVSVIAKTFIQDLKRHCQAHFQNHISICDRNRALNLLKNNINYILESFYLLV
jgi:hypothetical protein